MAMSGEQAFDFEGVDPILSKLPRDSAGGFRIGNCRLEKVIGFGGMGRVYRGWHKNLEVPVAIKCLHLANTGSNPRMALDRFKREAKLAALVSHENLIRVYDSGEERGIHYIVMELVEGETSRARVDRKGRLELFEALAIVHGVIKALKAAHEQNLIHRDIKPGNILISREAKIKLADLGLAKSLDQSALELTLKGSKLGTPRYAAPEQWQDASEATPATDIYAVGAVLYFFITGEDGIQGDSALEVIANTCRRGFPRLATTHAGFPPEIDQFIAKCTALRPEDRFQNATEMLRHFEPMVRKLRERRGPPPAGGRSTGAPLSTPAGRAPQPVKRAQPASPPSPARRVFESAPSGATEFDPEEGGAEEAPSMEGGHRRFLTFIGMFGILVYSILLWLAGQRHRGVLAAGVALAAVIAVLLVVYRRRAKRRKLAAAAGEG